MKKLFFILLCSATLHIYGQQTVTLTGNQKMEYYDSQWNRTEDKSKMSYYRIIEYTSATTCKGPIVYYYANGIKQSEGNAIYVDPVTESKDKFDGLVYFYNTDGSLKEVDLWENGTYVSYINADTWLNSKYRIGDKIEYLAQTGDQDIWLPAEVTILLGSNAYRLKPTLLGWGEVDTYEEYMRTPQPLAIKLILPSGASEPGIESLAKKEMLALRPTATILQTVMNGDNWDVTKDWYNVPQFRVKNGYVAYSFEGKCYTMHFLYSEDYSGGSYQKSTGELSLEKETPYICK
jgi:hypothetical protein